MKELGDAINESLSDSEQISEVVSRIKEGGYDIFLVLEATIGVSKQGDKSSDKTSLVTTLSTNPEFKINDQDLKFLRSLRIKIDEDKYDPDRHDRGGVDKDRIDKDRPDKDRPDRDKST
jgi:pentose-5-phosphate-3-epimerase